MSGAQVLSSALLPVGLAGPVTGSEVVRAYRANALFDAHRDDPEFGHRLLADEARMWVRRWRIGPRGASHQQTTGGVRSGRSAARMGRSPVRPSMTISAPSLMSMVVPGMRSLLSR